MGVESSGERSIETGPLLFEGGWARAIGSTPEWCTNLLFTLCGLPLAFLGMAPGGWTAIPIGISVALLVIGIVLSLLRRERENRLKRHEQDKIDTLRESLENEFYDIVDMMNVMVYQVVHGKMQTAPKALSGQMEVVQKSVLIMVGHFIGPKSGVRANLFTPDGLQSKVLTAARWGFHGANTPSDRTFRPGDRTYDLAMNKLKHVVDDTKDLPESELSRNSPYRTFATYPVGNNDKLFGILTVDAPQPGDLSEFDINLLGFFAGILALTFEDQKDALSIPRDRPANLWNDEGINHSQEGDDDD